MRLSALALALVVLAGCSGYEPETHFTVPEDAKSFQDAHTGDGYNLRVRVVDQADAPISGAAVVWFHGDGAYSASGSGSFSSEGGQGEFSFQSNNAKMIAGGRTNGDGISTADLEPGRSVHVAAGGKQGYTTEVRLGTTVGSSGDSGTITITLYPERVPVYLNVTMGNHVGATPYMSRPGMEAHPLPLSQSSELHAAYLERLDSITLAAHWENTPTQSADLYVGLGESEPTWVGQDNRQMVADGSHTEAIEVPEVEDLGALQVFLMTDWISASLDGIPIDLEGEAVLKGSNVRIS